MKKAGEKIIVSMACRGQPSKHFLFRIIHNNTRKRSKICSKLTIKTLEQRHDSGVFIVNFEYNNITSNTLSTYMFTGTVSTRHFNSFKIYLYLPLVTYIFRKIKIFPTISSQHSTHTNLSFGRFHGLKNCLTKFPKRYLSSTFNFQGNPRFGMLNVANTNFMISPIDTSSVVGRI